mmetsp:Transcript_3464/g.3954  ORF Transcript_3464/g.3954 Transcript_3464/m.3954 type:complete len:172 (+) Transcript_3464:105-620(+)
MATFPVFKAGALAVKTLAKPLASVLKESAKDHPLFRKACIRIGQLVHTTSTKLNMRLLGHKVKDIKPLNEAAAVSRGADMMGEGFIYSVSLTTVAAEVYRRDKIAEVKTAEKKRAEREKEEQMAKRFQNLHQELAALTQRSEVLTREVSLLKDKVAATDQPKSLISRVLNL